MTAALIAAALYAQIDLGALFHRASASNVAPKSACHVETVSYRFTGTPGTQFVYDGSRHIIPATGSIELINDRNPAEYEVNGRKLPLGVWPRDDFGTRTITLPRN